MRPLCTLEWDTLSILVVNLLVKGGLSQDPEINQNLYKETEKENFSLEKDWRLPSSIINYSWTRSSINQPSPNSEATPKDIGTMKTRALLGFGNS